MLPRFSAKGLRRESVRCEIRIRTNSRTTEANFRRAVPQRASEILRLFGFSALTLNHIDGEAGERRLLYHVCMAHPVSYFAGKSQRFRRLCSA